MIRPFPKFAAATLLALTVACGEQATTNEADAKIAAAKVQPSQDWSKTVVRTPDGGFRMGNPDAPVKLLEFASLTCPHCADFAKTGVPSLKQNYIRKGLVSYEFRPFILNSPDIPVSLMAYCLEPAAFFAAEQALYETQADWVGKFSSTPQDQLAKLSSMPQTQLFPEILRLMGLDNFFRLRGLPAQRQAECLADQDSLDLLAKVRGDAVTKYELTGTPTFVINGKKAEDAFSWTTLEPKIKAALK